MPELKLKPFIIRSIILALMSGLALFVATFLYITPSKALILSILSGIVIGAFSQYVHYWYEFVYSIRKKKQFINGSSVTFFKERGFEVFQDKLEGKYQNYFCQVYWLPFSPIHRSISIVVIEIFFKPTHFYNIPMMNQEVAAEELKLQVGECSVLVYKNILFDRLQDSDYVNLLDKGITLLEKHSVDLNLGTLEKLRK